MECAPPPRLFYPACDGSLSHRLSHGAVSGSVGLSPAGPSLPWFAIGTGLVKLPRPFDPYWAAVVGVGWWRSWWALPYVTGLVSRLSRVGLRVNSLPASPPVCDDYGDDSQASHGAVSGSVGLSPAGPSLPWFAIGTGLVKLPRPFDPYWAAVVGVGWWRSWWALPYVTGLVSRLSRVGLRVNSLPASPPVCGDGYDSPAEAWASD